MTILLYVMPYVLEMKRCKKKGSIIDGVNNYDYICK